MARCPSAQWSTISLHSIHLSQFTHTPLRYYFMSASYAERGFSTGSGFPARINNVIALLWHLSHETSNYVHLFASGCGAAVIAPGLYGE